MADFIGLNNLWTNLANLADHGSQQSDRWLFIAVPFVISFVLHTSNTGTNTLIWSSVRIEGN